MQTTIQVFSPRRTFKAKELNNNQPLEPREEAPKTVTTWVTVFEYICYCVFDIEICELTQLKASKRPQFTSGTMVYQLKRR